MKKYRVKYKCYWYNTGAADNHSYIEKRDFDSLEDAIKFFHRVHEQYEMENKWGRRKISYEEYSAWENDSDIIEVENGYILDYPTLHEVTPEIETQMNEPTKTK